MVKVKIFILFPALLLCSQCSKVDITPFNVNVVTGSYSLFTDAGASDSSGIEVNGKNVLQNAYIFHEKEKLVAIGSLGELDIIIRFSGDSLRGAIQLSLHNGGKEILSVNQVSLFSKHLNAVSDVQRMGDDRLQIHASSPYRALCLKAEYVWPWALLFDIQEDQLYCSLDISNASIILLPEEELMLPQLEFFYHLCPE